MEDKKKEYKYGKSAYALFTLIMAIVMAIFLFETLRFIVIQDKKEITVTCTKVVDVTQSNIERYERHYSDGYVETTTYFSPYVGKGDQVVFYEDRRGRVLKKGIYNRIYIYIGLSILGLFGTIDNYVMYLKIKFPHKQPFIVKFWNLFEKSNNED